jgi:hypothetical protein
MPQWISDLHRSTHGTYSFLLRIHEESKLLQSIYYWLTTCPIIVRSYSELKLQVKIS